MNRLFLGFFAGTNLQVFFEKLPEHLWGHLILGMALLVLGLFDE